MLEINNLSVNYGGIVALKDVSISVPDGKIVTLIGANGAGKSSTLRGITGLIKIESGEIRYDGINITGKQTKDIVKMGITLVPEGRNIFPDLTVYENLILGAYTRKDKNYINEDLEKVFSLFPRLKERKKQLGGTLSGGEQQMLAVGRALMARPKLLMLDEPSMGLSPLLVKEIFNIISKIHSQGVTILLIEQNAKAALKIADLGYVLETGRIILKGTGEELLQNDTVKKAYLGEKH
ncbi:MAG TPA: ABC transporter ATP-binding protein [Clostridiaceae bacterium]|nr:ABC transporter ATP-binding protein [Clostridiaceae bacterium]